MPPRKQNSKKSASSKTNSSSTPASAFLALPEEIHVAILKEVGSYFDLKRLGRTCKAIQKLLLSPTFDQELFRNSPSSDPLPEGTPITLHPLIQNIFDIAFPTPDKALIDSFDQSKFFIIINLKASSENATFPPISELAMSEYIFEYYFEIEGAKVKGKGKGKGKKGRKAISVKDFVEQVAKAWNKEMPSFDFDCDDEEEGGGEGEGMTLYDMFSAEGASDMGWNGWKETKVGKGGAVELKSISWYHFIG